MYRVVFYEYKFQRALFIYHKEMQKAIFLQGEVFSFWGCPQTPDQGLCPTPRLAHSPIPQNIQYLLIPPKPCSIYLQGA